MPRRPLTQYMVYYMEKKDKVAAQNPHLDMVSYKLHNYCCFKDEKNLPHDFVCLLKPKSLLTP